MSKALHALWALLLLGASLAAAADTLLIEGVDASGGPARGTSMDRVTERYGEPVNRYDAVGDPPITRWEYPGFVVYFEHQYVIHSVAKRGSS